MNSIKIAAALLLDKITGVFSKKEAAVVPVVYPQIKVEPVVTTTPAPVVAPVVEEPVVEEPVVQKEEPKKPKAKSRKKSKKG